MQELHSSALFEPRFKRTPHRAESIISMYNQHSPQPHTGSSSMPEEIISHAFVLPNDNFEAWFQAIRPYKSKFPRVAVVRSPRGNALNRYRSVSAVAAPQTWIQDDPAAHIRR